MPEPWAPPRAAIDHPSGGWKRIGWFLRSRVFRLAAAAAIWGLATDVFWPTASMWSFLIGAAIGLAVWTPTSTALFRVAFFPSEPDPRVDPNVGPSDHRWLQRVFLAEHLLSAVPLLLLGVWALVTLPHPWRWGGLLLVPLADPLVRQVRRGLRSLALTEAHIAIATEATEHGLRWLDRARRWGRGHTNAGWQLRALALAQAGRPTEALKALDQITHPERWNVEALRAKLAPSDVST